MDGRRLLFTIVLIGVVLALVGVFDLDRWPMLVVSFVVIAVVLLAVESLWPRKR